MSRGRRLYPSAISARRRLPVAGQHLVAQHVPDRVVQRDEARRRAHLGDVARALEVDSEIDDRPRGRPGREDDDAGAAAIDDIGPVDILFNCAGWVHQGNLLDCTIADWDRSFDLNVRAMFLVTKAMLPKMIAAGGGTVLNMASVVGAHKAAPNRLAYAASKAAVVGFTRALAIDHVKQNIRCNCVCPGTVDTPSLGERIEAFADPVQARKDFVARQPMGRLATAEEIAETFVYLASDESSFMTGQAIFVDGGMSL